MKLGVRGKLFLVSLAFVALIGIAVGVVLERQLQGVLEDRIGLELSRHAQTARDVLELSDELTTVEQADPVADRIGNSTGTRVTIIAPDGRVLGDSSLTLQEVRAIESHDDRPEVHGALSTAVGRSRRHSDTLGEDMTYVAVPFRDDGAVVRVGLGMEQVDNAMAPMRYILLVSGIVALLAAALLSALASQLLSRSLRALVATAQSIAQNDHGPNSVLARLPETGSDEIGGLAGSFNAMADELERTMATLARERNRFETVLETMDQAVLALDTSRRMTMVNQAARTMLELPDDANGRKLLEYVRVPALEKLVSDTERGESHEAEFEFGVMPRKQFRAVATPQRDGGVVLVVHDVTEIRRLERVRKDFVANVSHELRTPVAVIRANAETLLNGALAKPERAKTFVDALQRHAERLGRLVADLLDISRIEGGAYRLDLMAIEVGGVVDRTIEALASEAQQRGIAVRRTFDEAVWVRADDKALEQVLINLVSNAIRYSDGGELVEVAVLRADNRVRIEVRDDGPGIDPKHHARVFERFYRVDPGRSRDKGGTGLGLAIVKHLVEAMGGRVGIDARRPRGSVFWFALLEGHPGEDQLPLGLEPSAAANG